MTVDQTGPGPGGPGGDLWVFAYGSLLWDPGFVPVEAVLGTLGGFRRSFCMWSIRWRGTEAEPGLVLALDAEEGAACRGLALRVDPGGSDGVLAAIRARELVSDAYQERVLPVALDDGRAVRALAYVIRRDHVQYASLAAEAQASTIAQARGARGANLDYLVNTADRLAALGIGDAEIEALLARALALAAPP